MRKVLLIIMIISVGLSMNARDKGDGRRSAKRQEAVKAWHEDMAEFRSRSRPDSLSDVLLDSLAYLQGQNAIAARDFVLEARQVMFKNGRTVFVNPVINFISLKGDRAVVQVSVSTSFPGPSGLGGVSVEGSVSELNVSTDKKGNVRLAMNVLGAVINARVEIRLAAGSSEATATVYPNFSSNVLRLSGNLLPSASSKVFEGRSL